MWTLDSSALPQGRKLYFISIPIFCTLKTNTKISNHFSHINYKKNLNDTFIHIVQINKVTRLWFRSMFVLVWTPHNFILTVPQNWTQQCLSGCQGSPRWHSVLNREVSHQFQWGETRTWRWADGSGGRCRLHNMNSQGIRQNSVHALPSSVRIRLHPWSGNPPSHGQPQVYWSRAPDKHHHHQPASGPEATCLIWPQGECQSGQLGGCWEVGVGGEKTKLIIG